MAKLLSRQELEVGVEFYSFALQEADDSLVPTPFPEDSASGDFLSFYDRRIDIESGGHTHTALLTVEVWDSVPPNEASGDWEAEGEGEIESPTGELAICEMMGNSGTYVELGRPQTLWKTRIRCSGRDAVYRLAQVDVPSGIERYLVQFWPTSG
ncbi:hypothetical protein ACTPOK_39955 [Streptomyces inhibens]|uniref:hypothetical protein n=1 Tax=Streptomyces inhibens TaxID=2293571 RepID=UPI00402AA84A